MKTHYKWLLIGLALGLVLVTLALAKPTTSQKQSIVQILITDSSNASLDDWISMGSGTLIYDSKHILTNYHVIEDAIKNSNYVINVCFNLSETEPPACMAKATLLKAKASGEDQSWEEMVDLAVLEITTGIHDGKEEPFDDYQIKYNFYLPHIEIDTNNFSTYPVEMGDSIDILGFPWVGGETLTYNQGTVSGFQSIDLGEGVSLPWQIKTDAIINPGNSGGGVFDSEHNFIGVPSAYWSGEAGSVGYVIALPTVNLFLSNVTLRDCDSYDGDRCVCRYGYFADSTGTKCIRDESIRLHEAATQPLPDSQQIWGCIENATLNPADGLCYANEGYMWSDLSNALITYAEICQETFGNNIYFVGEFDSDGLPYCNCNAGYTWNSAGTACIKGSTTTQNNTALVKDGFNDVSSIHPYFHAINFVKQNGIVSGYDDGSFKPDNNINRAEFTKILVNTAFPEEIATYVSKACFKDIADSDWFTKYICLAKEKGVISGYPDNTFQPDKNINVAEALKITMEALYTNIPSKTGAWYQKYLDYAYEKGVMLSEWRDINKEITRGEMAEFIYRIKQSQP